MTNSPINPYTLDLAAHYINGHRNANAKWGNPSNDELLRERVTRLFGAVYAALLIK